MMRRSNRFWFFMLVVFLLDSVLVECKKVETSANGNSSLHGVRKRSLSGKDGLKFIAKLAIEATNEAVGSIPLVGTIATFIVGTLIDGLWPTNTYDSLRSKFIEDIHKEMNHQSIERMKMKIRDYGRQLRALFGLIHMPSDLLDDWQNSVMRNGLGGAKQRRELENIKQRVSRHVFETFKDKLSAITADIQNDRNNFHIPKNPATSLAYYREFATLEIALLTTELFIDSEDHPSATVRRYNENAIKFSAETHYHFVYWAAHKSAAVVETKTRKWQKYDEAVESVLEKFPLKEWRELSDFQDDSIYIRNEDAVSFKSVKLIRDTSIVCGSYMTGCQNVPTGTYKSSNGYRWMSCWGSGSKCETRDCPGEDNPFDAGDQYQFHYKCRGEVFWIFGDGRGPRQYIRACDKVALQYSFQNNKGYWLSYDGGWWSVKDYKTRTCPGENFFNSNFNGRCSMEVFTLEVEGRSCGEKVQDRDVLNFRQESGYVSFVLNRALGPLLKCSRSPHQWRIFKQKSFLKREH